MGPVCAWKRRVVADCCVEVHADFCEVVELLKQDTVNGVGLARPLAADVG
jgi:hypothetical protein